MHDLKSRLEESYRVATENASKTAERNKQRFDKRVVESTLEAGDRVLVRNVRIRGKHKLADKWESDVHIVVKHAGDLPMYVVKPEGKDGPLRTLHRDLLLPCGFLPVTVSEQPPKQTINKPRTRRQSRMEVMDESEAADGGSESEDNDCYYYSPGETWSTDFIEKRLLTRPETVSFKEKLLGQAKQPKVSSVGMVPAPVNLEEKAETTRHQPWRDRTEKRDVRLKERRYRKYQWRPFHPNQRNLQLSGIEPQMSQAPTSQAIPGGKETQQSLIQSLKSHQGAQTDFPNVRRALFKTSQDAPSDTSRQEDDTMSVQLSVSKSPSVSVT